MATERQKALLKIPFKYQVNALKSIIKKIFNADLEIKDKTSYVSFLDVKKFPVYTNGNVFFEKSNIHGQKKGELMILDVSDNEGFPPIEQIRIIALGEKNGQHLVILVTKTGDIISKNKEFWKDWFLQIGLNTQSTIRSLEIGKDKLLSLSHEKVSEVNNVSQSIETLKTQIAEDTQKRRTAQIKRTKMIKKNGSVDPKLDEEINICNVNIANNTKKLKELQVMVNEMDVSDVVSSDESDAEEFEEFLEKTRKKVKKEPSEETKKVKLSKEDKAAGNAYDLSSDETEYDSADDKTYTSSSSSSEDEEEEEEEEEEIEDDDDDEKHVDNYDKEVIINID